MSVKTSVVTSPGDTRRRILDAATELFRDRGYAGTSIRDIADSLGITKAALYYHFTCKDDMLDALVAPTVEAIEVFIEEAEAAEANDPAVLLRRFVEILACNVATLATALGDPVVLRSEAGRFRLMEKQVRLARLIAGPGADDAKLLRARAALGAVRASMEATGGLCIEAGDPCLAQKVVQQHIDTIIAAALGALQGHCPHLGPAHPHSVNPHTAPPSATCPEMEQHLPVHPHSVQIQPVPPELPARGDAKNGVLI